MFSKKIEAVGGLVAALVAAPLAASASPEEPALQDLVRILREQGVISEEQYGELATKAAAEDGRSWWDRIVLSGDFRARYERFEYHGDKRDRGRARYRARVGIAADVNPWVDVFVRLSTGGLDNRSGNQTMGGNADWGKDDIDIDRAYARISPFRKGEIPDVPGSLWVNMGRVPNPFRDERFGPDFMLWDGDVNMEGISLTSEADVTKCLNLFFRTGGFVDDENGGSRDPYLYAGQLGGIFEGSRPVQVGARTSLYYFGDLDSNFIQRGVKGSIGDAYGSSTSSAGNLLGGLTGNPNGGDLHVIETGGFVRLGFVEDWPVKVYGDWAQNLDASSTPGAGKEDTAWGVGIQIGDKKKYAEIGAGYWHIEANAFPSMFIDSDLFDGITNRKGWSVFGIRRILENTDVKLTAFLSDVIENGAAFDDSTSGAHRLRMQFDISYKFK